MILTESWQIYILWQVSPVHVLKSYPCYVYVYALFYVLGDKKFDSKFSN